MIVKDLRKQFDVIKIADNQYLIRRRYRARPSVYAGRHFIFIKEKELITAQGSFINESLARIALEKFLERR